MSRMLFIGTLLWAGAVVPAAAQRVVVPGDTVMLDLTDGGPSLTGIIRMVNSARLILHSEGSDDREVLVSVIRTMDVLDGRKRATRKGSRVGLMLGILAGAGVSAASAVRAGVTDFDGGKVPVNILAGALSGTLIGVVVGSAFETNRWQPAKAPDRGSLTGALRVGPVLRLGMESTLLVGFQLRR